MCDCYSNGRCSVMGKCVCDFCFIGDECKFECFGNGDCIVKKCKCNVCYIGIYCYFLCFGYGLCRNDLCVCDNKWKGVFCEVFKCLNDCLGNGICNSVFFICFCNLGWCGDDCS